MQDAEKKRNKKRKATSPLNENWTIGVSTRVSTSETTTNNREQKDVSKRVRQECAANYTITKIRPFKHTENFTTKK